MSTIYCLYSSADGKPRYIGQTTKPVAVRHQRHLRNSQNQPRTLLHRWIAGVMAQGFQVRAHVLQVNVHPAELNLFERYWMDQFAGLLNSSNDAPAVRVDTAVAVAIRRALRLHLQAEGPRILGAPIHIKNPRRRAECRTR